MAFLMELKSRKLYKKVPWCPNASIFLFWCSKSIRKGKKKSVFPLRFSSLQPRFQVCLSCLDQGELLPCDPDTQNLSSLTQAQGVRLPWLHVWPVQKCCFSEHFGVHWSCTCTAAAGQGQVCRDSCRGCFKPYTSKVFFYKIQT